MSNTMNTTTPIHRVVITGMGAISPAGRGVDALWDAVRGGKRCVGKVTRFDISDYDSCLAGEIPGYDAEEAGFSKKEARRYGRFVQYAILAADEAMANAGIDMEQEDATRFACVFGSGMGGMDVFMDETLTIEHKGPKRVAPLLIPQMISNMAAGNLSIRFGLQGECTNVVTACATGTHCVGEAFRAIRFGYADAALTGGTEESISPIALAGFGRLGALTKAETPEQGSMPFDVRRSGFVPAEGAGALVLESLEHARARNAHIIAEVVGFGSTGDAYHMTAPAPDGEGAARAMRAALAEGGFTPDDLGHLNAHGTSTHANDAMEYQALVKLCGSRADEIPVTSAKGATGHMLGAAGAIEAITTALSVAQSVVPPTVGFEQPDPEAPANVSGALREGVVQKVALSNSLGFGGHNGSLAIAPFTEGA